MRKPNIAVPVLPEVVITTDFAISSGMMDDCIKSRTRGSFILDCYSDLLIRKMCRGESYIIQGSSIFIARSNNTVEPKLFIAIDNDDFRNRKIKVEQIERTVKLLNDSPVNYKYKFPIR